MWEKQHVLIGVTGGIAAYKTVDLVSKLRKKGAQVTVVMTEKAQKFVTPITFQTISQNKVYTKLFNEEWDVRHISLGDRATIMAVVPATANFINKAAHGIADDLLSTVFLAYDGKKLIAPSMNVRMFDSPLTKQSLQTLKSLGCHIVQPDEGFLACGDVGRGRLPDTLTLLSEIKYCLTNKDLKGKKILVTAGPTIEPLDPVRYITNHSSGKMGYAIAKAAANRGADVILISGPTSITPPSRVKVIRVNTAQQMFEKVLHFFPNVDVVIKAAAVCDFKPESLQENKIKKKGEKYSLVLTQNQDILWELGKQKTIQKLVGFAAETEHLLNNAQGKLHKKNLDMIIANDVKRKDAGFKSDYNEISIIFKDGRIEKLKKDTKENLADYILDRVLQL